MKLEKVLRDLTAARPDTVAEVALSYLKQYDKSARIDDFGNVHGYISGNTADTAPPLFLDAHIDEIALIVTYITSEGFLKTARAGGVDRRVLPAQTVTVCGGGRVGYRGVVCTLPPHVSSDTKKPLDEDKIYIDCGFADKASAEKCVALGDTVSFDGEFAELLGGAVSSRALDDRAGVAAILECLDILKNGGNVKVGSCSDVDSEVRLKADISHRPIEVLFSNWEELGVRGAKIAAYNSRTANDPRGEAIAVDVTFAETPDVHPPEGGRLGGGVMLGISPTLDRGMFERLKKLASDNDIAYGVEVMSDKTGTNGDIIAETKGGVKTALLSIPERNMHMPVEVVSVTDVRCTAELLALYARVI